MADWRKWKMAVDSEGYYAKDWRKYFANSRFFEHHTTDPARVFWVKRHRGRVLHPDKVQHLSPEAQKVAALAMRQLTEYSRLHHEAYDSRVNPAKRKADVQHERAVKVRTSTHGSPPPSQSPSPPRSPSPQPNRPRPPPTASPPPAQRRKVRVTRPAPKPAHAPPPNFDEMSRGLRRMAGSLDDWDDDWAAPAPRPRAYSPPPKPFTVPAYKAGLTAQPRRGFTPPPAPPRPVRGYVPYAFGTRHQTAGLRQRDFTKSRVVA